MRCHRSRGGRTAALYGRQALRAERTTAACEATERPRIRVAAVSKWLMRKLGEICDVVSGSTPSTTVPEYWDGDVPWVTPKDLGKLPGSLLRTTERRITRSGLASCSAQLVPRGTVILSSRAPIGHLAVAEVECCSNQGCKNLVPRNYVNSWYLYFALKHSVPTLQELGSGATFIEISKTVVESFEIPLPPLPEQRRIAAELTAQMEEVQRMRRAAERQLAAARTLPGAYLREVFGSEEAKEWGRLRFGELVENYDGRRIPVKLEDRRGRQGQYPYYGASGIIDYIDEFLFEGEYLLVAEDGANLVLRSTPVAFRASGKFWVNNHAHVVQPKERGLFDYLLYFLEATDLKPYVSGAAQPKMTQSDMNSIPVSLPPLPTQRRVVAQLNDRMAQVEQTRRGLERQREAIAALPGALLHEVFGEWAI